MSDLYYKQGVLYIFRSSVYGVIDKYIEYLEEYEPDKVEEVSRVFGLFKVWLYRLAKD